MSAIINTTLTSIVTKESFIINRERIDGDEMKLIISRRYILDEANPHKCTGLCSAELRLANEVDIDILNTSFLARVLLSGTFECQKPFTDFEHDDITDTVLFQMLPHVRATLASCMAAAGLPPYLIPNTTTANFD